MTKSIDDILNHSGPLEYALSQLTLEQKLLFIEYLVRRVREALPVPPPEIPKAGD